MKNTKEYSYIVKTIAEYANVSAEDMKELSVEFSDNLFEVEFHTDWMYYTCYADLSGQVVGFLTEPVPMTMDNADSIAFSLDSAKCA